MSKKMTKAEREEVEKDLATLRRAVAQCEQTLKDDDAADKAAKAASDSEMIKAAAVRDGTKGGILLARELGRRGGPKIE